MIPLARLIMGLRALIATAALMAGSSEGCEPLDYYWPHLPYELHADTSYDPGLEARVLAESDKIPGPIRAAVRWHEPRPFITITYEPPHRVAWFSELDPERLNVIGRPTEESAAFITRWHENGQMIGYYNPARVAQGSASQNAILHEYGHIIYRVLGIPDDTELLESLRTASNSFRTRIEHHYPRILDEDAYEALILEEAFAEAFAFSYAHASSRRVLETRYPELARFMDRMESYAVTLLEERHGFDYEHHCELAHLINPPGWEPEIILNEPETPD